MRYSELNITTQRQAPARARSEGDAMLRRAGYTLSDGTLTALGHRSRTRLEELAGSTNAAGFFGALGLPVIEALGGEYYYTIQAGKVEVLRCGACGYAARRALAAFRKSSPPPETPAPLEKVATPESNTIEALARFLGIPKEKTAKALMYTRTRDNRFVFVVVRGDMQLSDAKLAQHIGEFRPATADEIIAAGATPGYASPIGLRQALVMVDDLVPRSPNLVAGANEHGFHLKNTNYGRDYRAEIVADLAMAEPDAPCPNCGQAMTLLDADLLADADGYDFDALLEALAETHHDEKGLVLPPAAAPFDVYLLHVPGKELDTRGQAAALHDQWQQAGLRVLLDDRDDRAGVKFTDADLIGCPMRATVGERGMKDGMVELKPRTAGEIRLVPFPDALNYLRSQDKAS
jgi:prolyl-tRNA synthetase